MTARALRLASTLAGLLALAAALVLLLLDLSHGFLTSGPHAVLSAAPLALVAIGYLCYQAQQQLTVSGWLKVLVLVSAFLFWSAYQLLPALPGGAFLNDLAIALFVLDVALVLGGSPGGGDWLRGR